MGSTFMVDLVVSGANDLYSVPVQLQYDPQMLQLLNVSNGGLLAQGGVPVALVHRDDPTTGTVQVTATRPPNSGGATGQGAVFTLTFLAKNSGQSNLSITRAGLRDAAMQNIQASGTQAVINIKGKQ